MKTIRLYTFLFASLFIISQSNAQKPVKEKDIVGNWKLIIDIEEELEKAKEEADEEDNFLGEMAISWVSGFVNGIIDEIEIYMEFEPKGEVKIIIDAFGEREIEYSRWHIDRKGRLFIEDTDSFETNDDDFWMIEDGLLISYDNDDYDENRKDNVYMVRLD